MDAIRVTSSCPGQALHTAAAISRLFSFAKQMKMAHTYHRVFDLVDDVARTSKRMAQDVKRTINAMETIHQHWGVFVPSLAGGHVVGHRHFQTTA